MELWYSGLMKTTRRSLFRRKFDALEKIVLELRNEIETIHSDRKARSVGLEENTIKRTEKNKGCPNNLPSVMTKNNDCKSLKLSCTKLKNKCNSKLGAVLDDSKSAKMCKKALKGKTQNRVNEYCQKTCRKCVEGNWGSWSSYGKCQCFQKRTRVCDNPKPLGGGTACSGLKSQRTECGDCMVTDLKDKIAALEQRMDNTAYSLVSLCDQLESGTAGPAGAATAIECCVNVRNNKLFCTSVAFGMTPTFNIVTNLGTDANGYPGAIGTCDTHAANIPPVMNICS